MRRSGFTMVELIFVIIIIGILSVAALPKFGDIRDRAKVNSEAGAMEGLNSAIIAKMEFQMEDTGNIQVDWHDNVSDGTAATTYTTINDDRKVLKSIIKKGDDIHIVAYYDTDADAGDPINGVALANNSTAGYDDILALKGAASNSVTGIRKDNDAKGKPDKNDFWIFNGTSESIKVFHNDGNARETLIESGELALIDNDAKVIQDTNIDKDNAATSGKFNVTKEDGTTAITLTQAKHTVNGAATDYTY